MQETLLIYLHPGDAAHVSWAVIDAQSQVRQSAVLDSPEGLSSFSPEKTIIAVVPAQDVLLMSVIMPKLNRARLMQALPYTLEDQLSDDVETLHFAANERSTEGDVSVAIVKREKMRQWLSQLSAWGIKPDTLIPATFCVPYSSGEWNAMMTDITIVRTGLMAGFACEPEQLSEWLEMLLSNTVPQPTRVQLHHYNDTVTSITHQVVPIENINHAPEQWITAMAMESLQAPALNLLQGSFAVKKPTFLKINKVWKIIAALVGAWIALIILYPIVSYAILKSHLHSVQGQMMQIYKHHFPQANHLLAPKVRMEEKLHQAMASVGEDHFLLSLAYVGKAFAQTPGVTLKHLEYQGDKLTLDVSAKTAEDFAAVTTYLTQQGLNVSQQNATMSGERIHAIIQIG